MAKKIFLSLCFLLMLLVLADFGAKNISADFVKEAENKNYVLSTDPKTLAIQVENKASGYIWSSTIDNLSNQGLNASWQQFVSSAISIDYINNFDKQRSTNLASGAQISFLKQAEGFRANIHFRQAGIGLALVVTLTDKGIEIKVPQDSITESNLGRLVDLNLYPFLGASKGAEESGYLLIPDGSGAEIDYQDPIQMTNAYSQPYYGSDSGISPINLNDNSYPIRLPSYGRVNGTDAYMAYVKSGAEYGTLTATKAGLQTNFNW
ncbi:MAG: DUF5696 domain-containing protein, partial [Streptococcaceae bacterium]|nr:DUF5696 domain-containing protein [Streptococcaceae bacterium]